MISKTSILALFLLFLSTALFAFEAAAQDNDRITRVFIFAGQSNMVGSDSKVEDIQKFPPFVGVEKPQSEVKFSYCLGRENKTKSNGWVDLVSVNSIVGPELSFARKVGQNVSAPIAIIKCAAGGTHLGGDWNPDDPSGFKMYPLALDLVKSSLSELDEQNIKYQIEGFFWHQGENDMFDEAYKVNYGRNLTRFIEKWRQDLNVPQLKFYIGELCTKTIWGMDLRPRMYAISQGQKSVAKSDPLAEYIPTSHVGVEIGSPVGLHYHYGTLGQLEHGVNYADAYLDSIGIKTVKARPLKSWPYPQGSKVRLFVLAGHRNMEGERAFIQELKSPSDQQLLKNNQGIAFKYSLGGGVKKSRGWEPLGPAGYYDTFGPELSFGAKLQEQSPENIAIAKFTHSGTQVIDWTPAGSVAKSRNIYPDFIAFVKDSIREIQANGNEVELAGVFYHMGENDTSFGPHRRQAADWLESIVGQCRKDLELPKLDWFVSQQLPTDHERVNSIDVTSALENLAVRDQSLIHIKAFDLPARRKLVIGTEGVVRLGEVMAESFLQNSK